MPIQIRREKPMTLGTLAVVERIRSFRAISSGAGGSEITLKGVSGSRMLGE